MRTVYVNNNSITLTPVKLIGEGGEAEIYRIDSQTVLKLYKLADHHQFQNKSAANRKLQQAARIRIADCQEKLPRFPKGIAPHLVEPIELVHDSMGPRRRIIGYTMPFIRQGNSLRDYTQRSFRESSGITNDTVIDVFRDLHDTINRLHKHGVVIGDFNHFNVIVSGTAAHLIDADSMQYGGFLCTSYTPRYADPLTLEKHAGQITMVRPHSRESDWYAYAIHLFECLLYVHPYGGVYKPADAATRVSADERPLKRLSVFSTDVKYPAMAVPLDSLPGPVIEFYQELLLNDRRGTFPYQLLDLLQHGTTGSASVPPAPPVGRSNGNSSSRTVFKTRGVILKVVHDGSSLQFIYHEDGKIFRESGQAVLTGRLDPALRFAICGASTICGKGANTFLFGEDGLMIPLKVEQYRQQEPIFDANASNYFFVEHGQLFRNSRRAEPKLVDEVLSEQTKIWLGPKFGFGFYLAGEFRRAFLFDGELSGRTLLDVEPLRNTLLNIDCRFTADRLWLLIAVLKNGQLFNRLAVFNRNGILLGQVEAPEASGTWLDYIASSCAATFPLKAGGEIEALLVATPDGVIRIEESAGRITETRIYQGTEKHVQPGDHLLFTESGLYAWSSREIRLITTS